MAPPPEFSLEMAWQVAKTFIADRTAATAADLDTAAALAHGTGQQLGSTLTVGEIRRFLESKVVVAQRAAAVLETKDRPTPWLDEARRERPEPLWERYYDHLDRKGRPTSVLRRLDESTRDILGRIRDPRSPGRWRSCGLVVGEVQSGKTENFIGLACRAADMGYRLIIVLAGMQNSLRSQTQLRVDDGFTGYDTKATDRADRPDTPRIGVGLIRHVTAWSFTDSRPGGDFKKTKAESFNVNTDDVPLILVVKKNIHILENLRDWIDTHQATGNDTEGRAVRGRPLLIIDDEADQASIDTAKTDPDSDPTRINQEIRLLLKLFERAAYVGYTATPYANLFADHTADHDKYGADLFPRDFIISLRAPSNHFGPVRVFGLESPDEDTAVEPLPVVRTVKDADAWLPARHKTDWIPPEPPASVIEAIRSYVIAGAVRTIRGQGREHHSMLIHGTRLQRVQQRVHDQIADLVQELKTEARIESNRPGAPLWRDLEKLWRKDHVSTSATIAIQDPGAVQPSWEQVRAEIPAVLDRIRVRMINGESDDVLDYDEHQRTGLYAIAIGGDKLSRGLTLEGLTVSYYLRTSDMYDTLLQMGRWFGYRPGYEDLCRLYTTDDLLQHYVEITAATEEMRYELEYMAETGQTPSTYGLGVRQSTNGLLVTSPAKMRRSDVVRLTFSSRGPESTVFNITSRALTQTTAAVETLVNSLTDAGTPTDTPPGQRPVGQPVLWRRVPPRLITDFLRGYAFDNLSQRVRPDLIARYIETCTAAGELTEFSVMLVSVATDQPPHRIGPLDIIPSKRSAHGRNNQPGLRYRIRRVLNPVDEMEDLAPDQKQAVREKEAAGTDLGNAIRNTRRPGQQALLIIYPLAHEPDLDLPTDQLVYGYKLSFPSSDRVVNLPDLRVNRIWNDFCADQPDSDDDIEPDRPESSGQPEAGPIRTLPTTPAPRPDRAQ